MNKEEALQQQIDALSKRCEILEHSLLDMLKQTQEAEARITGKVIETLGKEIRFRGGRTANVKYGDEPPEDLMQKHPFQK